MNQEVTDYINAIQQPWQVEVCDRLRRVAHEAIPDVTERIQYGKPHFLKDGKYAAVLAPAKAAVRLTTAWRRKSSARLMMTSGSAMKGVER